VGGRSLDGMVPENRVHIDSRRGPTITGIRRHSGLLVGHLIALGRRGNQVRQLVGTGTLALFILDGLIARIIVDSRKLLDLKGGHL
jgi:hypothetical protein